MTTLEEIKNKLDAQNAANDFQRERIEKASNIDALLQEKEELLAIQTVLLELKAKALEGDNLSKQTITQEALNIMEENKKILEANNEIEKEISSIQAGTYEEFLQNRESKLAKAIEVNSIDGLTGDEFVELKKTMEMSKEQLVIEKDEKKRAFESALDRVGIDVRQALKKGWGALTTHELNQL